MSSEKATTLGSWLVAKDAVRRIGRSTERAAPRVRCTIFGA